MEKQVQTRRIYIGVCDECYQIYPKVLELCAECQNQVWDLIFGGKENGKRTEP